MNVSEPLHPDFQKILKQFQKRYGVDQGTNYFWAWINKLGLNPEKPYEQAREAFRWAEPHFQLIKSDTEAKWYKVEAAFPLSSMNLNVYTREELKTATKELRGKLVNLNHLGYKQASHLLDEVLIFDAEYEDDVAEVLLRVPNGAGSKLGLDIQKMIDEEDIVHVSIEADCVRGWGWSEEPEGWVCKGLHFTGLALLTKEVLPGIPLTRITPVEKIVENFMVMEDKSLKEKQEDSTFNKTIKPVDKSGRNGKSAAERLAKLNLEVSELKRLNRELQEMNAVLEKKLEIKEKDIHMWQTTVSELENQKEVLQGKLDTAEEFNTKMLADLNVATEKCTVKEKNLEKLTGQHKDLVAEMEKTKALLKEEQDAHYEAATENLQLTSMLTSRNNEILALKRDIEKLTCASNNEIESLNKTIHRLNEKVKKSRRIGRILVKA